MPLGVSLEQIFRNLETWSAFPKYALERRIDIFLTPYLEEFLSSETTPRGQVELVAPEFPILSHIVDVVAGTKRLDEIDARTVNADYLLLRRSPSPAWLLVELKTDSNSIDEKQFLRYQAAQRARMTTLLDHIRRKIAPPRSTFHLKYQQVLNAVNDALERAGLQPDTDLDIEIVYLAPSQPKDAQRVETWPPGKDVVRYHALADFAAMTPAKHRALWEHVSPLLQRLT